MLSFADIIGNDDTKTQLVIAAQAAKGRNSSVPHLLFGGHPGCGKTTSAQALSSFLNVPFIQADPSSIKSAQDVYNLAKKFPLEGYDRNGNVVGQISPPILFFDEIHGLNLKAQEILGIMMENRIITMPAARQRRETNVWVPKFTLVGATTMTGKLSKPFRDRFKASFKFETYSLEDLLKVVSVHSSRLGVPVDAKAAVAIASRSRGVPRLSVGFLERASDYLHVLKKDVVDIEIVNAMFSIMGIDESGLTLNDVKVLKMVYDSGDAPIGLDTLAIVTNDSPSTIAHEVEPYLIQNGYMIRTPRGRLLTEKGIEFVESKFYRERNGGLYATKEVLLG